MTKIEINKDLAAALAQASLDHPDFDSGSEETQKSWKRLRKATMIAKLTPPNPSPIVIEIITDAMKKVTGQ